MDYTFEAALWAEQYRSNDLDPNWLGQVFVTMDLKVYRIRGLARHSKRGYVVVAESDDTAKLHAFPTYIVRELMRKREPVDFVGSHPEPAPITAAELKILGWSNIGAGEWRSPEGYHIEVDLECATWVHLDYRKQLIATVGSMEALLGVVNEHRKLRERQRSCPELQEEE